MFSNKNPKEIEKDLIPKSTPSDQFKKKGFFGEIWSNKTKRYIAIAITTTIILTIIVVIIVVSRPSNSDNSSDNDSNSKNSKNQDKSQQKESDKAESESDKTESDSTESDKTESDSTESDKTESDSTESDKTESDSTESDSTESDSTETDYIKPDCTGTCDKPYDIMVYSDNALKSKLKECGYSEGTTLFEFCMSAIKRHNILRACHNAQPLMFNCEILKISQDYSQYLVDNNLFDHSGNTYQGKWMGENLAYVWGSSITGETPTDMWYEEISDYDFSNPSFQSSTGHFTQVVWKDSSEFGIGLACKNNNCKMTGNYYPGGNYGYASDYARNVQNLQ